jgi:hypothetical protein
MSCGHSTQLACSYLNTEDLDNKNGKMLKNDLMHFELLRSFAKLYCEVLRYKCLQLECLVSRISRSR